MILLILSFALNAETISSKQIENICEHYKYDRCKLLVSISSVESDFRTDAHNKKENAIGLLQMKCSTAKYMGLKYSCSQLYSPMIAIRFAVKYLRYLESKGYILNQHLAAAYNAGGVYYCKRYKKNNWLGGGKCYPGLLVNDSYVYRVMKHFNYLLRAVQNG